MLAQLCQVEKRYAELQQQLCDPIVLTDSERYRQLLKESARLEPVAEQYRRYVELTRQRDEVRTLLSSPVLQELAEAELLELADAIADCEQQLKVLLLPQDPNDDRNVILEIRAGAGGEESALFAASLFRMYTMYTERQGFRCEVLNVNETELGGYKEIVAMITGQGAYSRLKFESGVHRVQRVPETESGGGITRGG